MKYAGISYRLPHPLLPHVLHFESEIENAVHAFAAALPFTLAEAMAGSGSTVMLEARRR